MQKDRDRKQEKKDKIFKDLYRRPHILIKRILRKEKTEGNKNVFFEKFFSEMKEFPD